MTADERTRCMRGELVVREARNVGENLCAVFHPESWVRRMVNEGDFAVVDVVPGQRTEFLYQDTCLVQRPARS